MTIISSIILNTVEYLHNNSVFDKEVISYELPMSFSNAEFSHVLFTFDYLSGTYSLPLTPQFSGVLVAHVCV